MSGQSPNSPTVTESLAARLAAPVSAEDRDRAALCVLDWAGCAVAGAASPAGRAMRAAVGDEGGLQPVLYTGALGNVLEMDDVDKRALLHPGPVVMPAALVAAELAEANAAAFLDGVVRGYEAVIRVGRAVGPDHYRYWHNTGTCGPFGAAAAAASIFGLDAEKTVWALGLAGTQASGFWQTRHEPQSFAKQLHTARAAHAGLTAAQLAKYGFVGLKTILEGPQGFFAATCGDADPRGVVDFGGDAAWAIHDVSVKPWPACRHAHAAIDAALVLREEGATPANVDKIVIRTYRDAVVFCDNPAPQDVLSAKFSLQHAVAVVLARGAPSLEDFEGAALTDAELAGLRAKTAIVEDETFTERYPARFGTAVSVALKDGGVRSADIPDALGDPENPASRDMALAKAAMLMRAGGMADRDAEALTDAALALAGEGGSVAAFSRLLKAGILS